MPPIITYKLLLAIEVTSDLQGHISPMNLRDVLRAEADTVDRLDDYIVIAENREYLTVVAETVETVQ